MTRAATYLLFAGAISAAGLAFGGCGSSEGGPQASAPDSARIATTRRADGAQGVKLVCPERKSLAKNLSITNGFTDRKIYPVVTGVNCDAWSGTGNPGYMNGEEIQPGQTLRLNVEVAAGDGSTRRGPSSDPRMWTIDVGQTTVAHLDKPVTVHVFSQLPSRLVFLKQPDGNWSCRAMRIPDARGGFMSVSSACRTGEITIGPG